MTIINIQELTNDYRNAKTSVGSYTLDVSSTPIYTNAFSPKTSSIRVIATRNCWIAFNEEASEGGLNSIFLPAGETIFFGVIPVSRLSVVEATTYS